MIDFTENITALKEQGMLRHFTPLTGRNRGYAVREGQKLLNLSSNDYLGIAGDDSLLEAFYQRCSSENRTDEYALGVSSSRLLTGDNPISHQLELLLSTLYKSEKTLLFNSGYHANIGIIPSLFGKNDLILSDKFNHASLHDGLRISRADCKRFNHRDYDQLHLLLEKYRHHYRTVVIVSESVFSMDGDCADISRLVALKKEFDCLLYLDEAHGIGLYGERGLGLAEGQKLLSEIDLLVGTFGKAVGSIGAFLICSKDIYTYLVNSGRSLIFTTALPPVVLSWNHFIMERVPAMKKERTRLQELSARLRSSLKECGLKTCGDTNIVPVILGDALLTVKCSSYLQEQGFLIMPVRPPTVPKGTSRFRLSLTADLEWEQLRPLPELIRSWLTTQKKP